MNENLTGYLIISLNRLGAGGSPYGRSTARHPPTPDPPMVQPLTQPRLIRLTLGILVPPLAMALCYVVINTWLWGLNMGLAIGWLTLTQAFSLATIQLLTYSLLMEFLVVPNLRNIHAVAVVSGLLLVVTVVSTFVLFFGIDVRPFANDQLTPSLGFIIGCLLGYGLKLNTQKQRKRALGSQET